MKALSQRYHVNPREYWDDRDDSEVVRFCFGGGSEQQETETEPWDAQKPYLKELFHQAGENILKRPLEFFPGSTVVPYSPETRAGMRRQARRARAGSPLLRDAQSYTGDVIGGDYLSGSGAEGADPAAIRDSVLSAVEPAVSSRWAGAGRSGRSPLANEAFGRGVSRGLAPYEFQAAENAANRRSQEWMRERGLMEGAAARAPALAREDYFDIAKLGEVGAMREAKKRERLADKMARWDFYQNEPANRIERFGRNIQGNYGGTSTSTVPGANPLRS
jgi:hypothetical protein